MKDTKGMNPPIKKETNKVPNGESTITTSIEKPKKLEEKPFTAFVTEDFIPSLKTAFKKLNIDIIALTFEKGMRPVIGGDCWIVFGEISQGKKFWLCFSTDKITSSKHIALAEGGSKASLLESFLIDERKITLPLLQSRLLQRLNGQKWLGKN